MLCYQESHFKEYTYMRDETHNGKYLTTANQTSPHELGHSNNIIRAKIWIAQKSILRS